jgi:hypothetical protein
MNRNNQIIRSHEPFSEILYCDTSKKIEVVMPPILQYISDIPKYHHNIGGDVIIKSNKNIKLIICDEIFNLAAGKYFLSRRFNTGTANSIYGIAIHKDSILDVKLYDVFFNSETDRMLSYISTNVVVLNNFKSDSHKIVWSYNEQLHVGSSDDMIRFTLSIDYYQVHDPNGRLTEQYSKTNEREYTGLYCTSSDDHDKILTDLDITQYLSVPAESVLGGSNIRFQYKESDRDNLNNVLCTKYCTSVRVLLELYNESPILTPNKFNSLIVERNQMIEWLINNGILYVRGG